MTNWKNISTATLVSALRCTCATAGNCIGEACPFWKTEDVPDDLRAHVGADVWGSCDCDAVGMAAAERMEELVALCDQPILKSDTLNQYRDRIYADAVAHGLWEHGGGNLAYLAAEYAFDYNSYEAQMARVVKGTAEIMQNEYINLLKELAAND